MTIGTVSYLIIKSIHIIFMVSYFAGIFYLLRLFVYHEEAKDSEHPETLRNQFEKMIQKLWNIIIVPAGTIMLVTGLSMLFASDFALIRQPWMHIKLTILLLFLGFHLFCWRLCKQILVSHKSSYSSLQFRKINEIPTLFLFAIIFVVILKQNFITYFPKLLISFVVLIIVIFLIVRIVNRKK